MGRDHPSGEPGSVAEQGKWLGYIEADIEVLVALALAATPEGSAEHRRVRWTGIRLRIFLNALRPTLGLPPP
jgi:hypothetical protein